ncbi:MAG: imidazole glycerol phosphate synthase subunit HisH [Clostridiales bacterium]|nr:imidazole glycerol phosphate synthase subunit HisH [Clostridiales bacterium]
MIAIVDYGVGNLFSLCSSFKKIGADVTVTSEKSVIENARKIILPGVGAFEDAAKKLRETGLGDVVKAQAKSGKYMMGICLGMQLLLDKSFEYGCHEGLGLIAGNVTPIKGYVAPDLKIPHIGWNGLHFPKEHFLFKYLKEGDHAYFVHSYHATDCQDVIATTEYDKELTAAIGKDNVLGCQFHPEKSGEVGLRILRAFIEQKD